jgi:mycoredoxin
MPEATPQITIYIRPWCGGVMRVKRWLDQKQLSYTEIDVTADAEAARYIEELNGGYQSVPTIVVDGKHVATEPSTAELEQIFG